MRKQNLTKLILILSAVTGISTAFIKKGKPQGFYGTTYYAITNGSGHFWWTTTRPNPIFFFCQENALPYCTIVTIGFPIPYSPQPDILPNFTQAYTPSMVHSAYQAY